nr:MAG TPA: hypothetical protein [Caudoviricetes sp.]
MCTVRLNSTCLIGYYGGSYPQIYFIVRHSSQGN